MSNREGGGRHPTPCRDRSGTAAEYPVSPGLAGRRARDPMLGSGVPSGCRRERNVPRDAADGPVCPRCVYKKIDGAVKLSSQPTRNRSSTRSAPQEGARATAAHEPRDTPLVYTRNDASEADVWIAITAIAEIACAMHKARRGAGVRPERKWLMSLRARTLRGSNPSEAFVRGGQTPDDIRAAQRALDAAVPPEQWVGVAPILGVEPHERPSMLTIGNLALDAARELAGAPTERIVHAFRAGGEEPEKDPCIGLFSMRLDHPGLLWAEIDDALTRSVRLMSMGSSQLRAWTSHRGEATVQLYHPRGHLSLPIACAVYAATGRAGLQTVSEEGLADRVLGWVQATIYRLLKNRMRDDDFRRR